MAKQNALVELPGKQTRDRGLELRMLLTEIATGNHRLSQLSDDLAQRRRALRDLESHHTAMTYRLAGEGEAPTTPPVQFEKRKKDAGEFQSRGSRNRIENIRATSAAKTVRRLDRRSQQSAAPMRGDSSSDCIRAPGSSE